MFIEKIPDHLILQYPFDAGSFTEDARILRHPEGSSGTPEHRYRIGYMLDYVARDHDVRWDVKTFFIVVASLKFQLATERSQFSLITWIKTETRVCFPDTQRSGARNRPGHIRPQQSDNRELLSREPDCLPDHPDKH